MIYLYDKAIAKDLQQSFNPENMDDPVIKVIETDVAIGLHAQIRNDNISFPIVAVTRMQTNPIDTDRMNFTRAHRGVAAVFDNEKNNLYYERAIPVSLNYTLTVLATNVVDRDEIIRELIFKYLNMYFLTIKIPYESKRKIRFGICIDQSQDIEYASGTLDYLQSGQVYQCIIPMRCEGCVMLHYIPSKLKNITTQYEVK